MGISIPQYAFVRRLDRQGIAPVWLAEQAGLERFAAVRVLSTDDKRVDQALVDAFEREGRLLAHIRHENVVNVYEIGAAGAVRYRAMEYLDGGSLADRIHAPGLTPRVSLGIALQLASAVAAVHRAGTCLQNLSPESILLRGDGSPVLTDLGLLRAGFGTARAPSVEMEQHSNGYLSPEQLDGRAADARSNVYMLGRLLYDLLTGEAPPDRSRAGVPEEDEIADRLKPLAGDLEGIEPILRRMLAAQPEHRYPQMTELISDLGALASAGTPADPMPILEIDLKRGAGRRKTRIHIWAPGTALVLVGAAITAWQLFPTRLGDNDLALLQRELMDFSSYMSRMDIYGPRGANATASLQRLMAISRSHPEVIQASNLLAGVYLQDAQDSRRRSDFEDALRLAERGLEFAPGHAELSQLKADVSREMAVREVEDLLQAAGAAMLARNYLPPAQGNAYALLGRIQQLDPGNPRADVFRREIQLQIAERARFAWSEQGLQQAKGVALEGLGLFPDSLLLRDLMTDLEHAELQANAAGSGGTLN